MAGIFVLAAILILCIQPGRDFVRASLPIIAGVLAVVIVGEVLVTRSAGAVEVARQEIEK